MKIINIQKDDLIEIDLGSFKTNSQGQFSLMKKTDKFHPYPEKVEVEERAKEKPSST